MRAIACLVLLFMVRVLNLAVPILYKHLIDLLAAASATSTSASATGMLGRFPLLASAAHTSHTSASAALDAGSGAPLRAAAAAFADVAKKYTYMELVYPWGVLYLVAVFFQGGAFMVGVGGVRCVGRV